MNDKIMLYLLNEKNVSEAAAKVICKTVCKYDDIKKEFETWLETRTFPEESGLRIEGYTAYDIAEREPSLDGIGVYNFMVTLRENPQKAKEYIDKGFPKK